MSERRDDTTEPLERGDAPPEPARTPGSYYYDDDTGYEVYDPSAAEDESREDDAGADLSDAGLRREQGCP
jgi:hypothetical protein